MIKLIHKVIAFNLSIYQVRTCTRLNELQRITVAFNVYKTYSSCVEAILTLREKFGWVKGP